jgi:hypothetical protein
MKSIFDCSLINGSICKIEQAEGVFGEENKYDLCGDRFVEKEVTL